MTFTPHCPGLPLVTRARLDPDQFRRLHAAVHEALSDPHSESIREALLIEGADDRGINDYQVILKMESTAAASGYAELR